MSDPRRFDAIVIGTGQGGKPLATALAEDGRRTAIIERHLIGGSCINYGCTPTKTLVASAKVAYLARRSQDFGIHTDSIRVNLEEVQERKTKIVESFREGTRSGIEETENLELIRGEACFEGPNTVSVKLENGGNRSLESQLIIINTGSRPRTLSTEGLDQVSTLDSTSILDLRDLPEHLLVVGAGYVGMEFSQMFRRFGSQVTVVQRDSQVLSREDEDVAQEVLEIFQEEGIEVLLDSEVSRVQRGSTLAIEAEIEGPNSETREVSHLLIAAGRVPNSDRLELEKAGIKTDDKGHIQVNDRLETSAEGIYAMGDVTGGPAFTHISYDDFRVLEANLLGNGDGTTRNRLVPYTVYIDPQLGSVGLNEKLARKEGRKVRVAKMEMSSAARAIETSETRGLMKALVEKDGDQILGCTILGIEGGEIMSAIQIAMMARLPFTDLRDGIFAHPTLVESLNNLFSKLE